MQLQRVSQRKSGIDPLDSELEFWGIRLSGGPQLRLERMDDLGITSRKFGRTFSEKMPKTGL